MLAPVDRHTHRIFLPVANVIGFILVLALNGISASGKLGGPGVGAVSRMYYSLVNVAGYALSIWGIVYAGVGVFCAWQCSPAQRCDVLVFDRIGYWFVASCLGNILWIVCFVQATPVAWIIVSTVDMFALVVTLLVILLRCRVWTRALDSPAGGAMDGAGGDGSGSRKLSTASAVVSYIAVDFTFSVYAGWTSVAAVLNVTSCLIGSGHYGGAHPDRYAVAMIVVAACIFLAVVLRPCTANWAFGFVFPWAAVAISKGSQCGGLVQKGGGEFFRSRAIGGTLADEEACARVQGAAAACAVLVGVVAGGRLLWWVWRLRSVASRAAGGRALRQGAEGGDGEPG